MDIVLSGQIGPGFIALAAPTVEKGVKRRRYHKEVIRVGKFVKAADNISFQVTPGTLTNWVKTFQDMKANGVRVPIPATHDGAGDPDANRGYVDELYIDGNALVMNCTLIGDDGIMAAERSDVSIASPREYTDGHGNTYRRPITHVALCTDPVVPGLGEFIPLAASAAATENQTMLPLLKKLGKALGVTDEITEDNAEKLLGGAISSLKSKLKEVKASLDAKPSEKPKPDDKPQAKTPDPLLVKAVADNRGMKLDALVASHKITKAVRDQLAAQFIGEENAAITLALSSGDTGDTFDAIVKAFGENDPVKLREQTGAQTMELSDSAKGKPEKSPVEREMDERAEAAKN